jgi:hypothetical protein
MPSMNPFLHAIFASLLCLALSSCDTLRGKPKYQLSVHVQASATDMQRDIIPLPYQGQQLIFKKVPEFSQRSIAAFESFASDDGFGNGLVLKLDAHGRNQLETVTRTHQGELLLTFVNGVPVDIIQIDQPIADGKFVVWRGVSDETVAEMGERLAHISAMKSSGKFLDMTPSTERDKKDAHKAELEEKKYLEEMARRAERGEDISLPPRTKEIPLE